MHFISLEVRKRTSEPCASVWGLGQTPPTTDSSAFSPLALLTKRNIKFFLFFLSRSSRGLPECATRGLRLYNGARKRMGDVTLAQRGCSRRPSFRSCSAIRRSHSRSGFGLPQKNPGALLVRETLRRFSSFFLIFCAFRFLLFPSSFLRPSWFPPRNGGITLYFSFFYLLDCWARETSAAKIPTAHQSFHGAYLTEIFLR